MSRVPSKMLRWDCGSPPLNRRHCFERQEKFRKSETPSHFNCPVSTFVVRPSFLLLSIDSQATFRSADALLVKLL